MNKSYGENKFKYINKNKFNKKKTGFSDHRGKESVHKLTRNYVKSYLNQYSNHEEILEEFIYPSKYSNTYTWYDCDPYQPVVSKIKHF